MKFQSGQLPVTWEDFFQQSPIYRPHENHQFKHTPTKVRLKASAYKRTKTGQCFHLAIFDSTKTQPLLPVKPTTGFMNGDKKRSYPWADLVIDISIHRKSFIIPKSLHAKDNPNLGTMMKLYQVIYI